MKLDVIQSLLPQEASNPIYPAAWIFTGIVFLVTALIVFSLYWGEGRRHGKKPEEKPAEASPETAPEAQEPPSEEEPAESEEPSEEENEEAPIPEEPTPDETKES